MSVYVRKTIKTGPYRVVLSRTGVCISKIIPGFRIRLGPRCNYARVSRDHIVYGSSARIGKTLRKNSGDVSGSTTLNLSTSTSGVVLDDVPNGSPLGMAHLVESKSSDLLGQINKAANRRLIWPWIVVPCLIFAVSELSIDPIGSVFWLLVGAVFGGWRFKRDEVRRSVTIFYDIDHDIEANYERLVNAFREMLPADYSWLIDTQSSIETKRRYKMGSDVKSVANRQFSRCSLDGPKILKTNIEIPSLESESSAVYLLPDRIFVRSGRQFADISYADLRLSFDKVKLIERGRPPGLEHIANMFKAVGSKYGSARLDKDRSDISDFQYGELAFKSTDRVHSVWQFSKIGSAEAVASAVGQMCTPVPTMNLPIIKPLPTISEPTAHSFSIPAGMVDPLKAASTRLQSQWLPEEAVVEVAGRAIVGGMFYFGRSTAKHIEAALVDPSLPVDWERPNWGGDSVGYWPTYGGLDARARAAFLDWLANGRSAPDAYIGYVFLYFYGIERRVLVDLESNPTKSDLVACAQEVRRLLAIYGDNSSFRFYASAFLDLIDAILASAGELEAPIWSNVPKTWEVPLSVRVAIGRFMKEGKALPASWALVFLRTHPEAYLRTPASRCSVEFDELFLIRYNAKFGDGMVITPSREQIAMRYHSASSSLRDYTRHFDLPDISKIESPIIELREIAAGCTDDLDAYSRYVGKNPNSINLPIAKGLLPDELFRTRGGQISEAFQRWIKDLVDDSPRILGFDELVTHCMLGSNDEFAKSDTAALAGLLSKLRIGIEPDIRFGGTAPQSGSPVILFPLPDQAPSAPSPEYTAALLLVDLAAVVASADGIVSEEERRFISSYLSSALELSEAEHSRLEARLLWHTEAKPSFVGVKRRIEGLDAIQRAAICQFLVDIAAADGVVSPEEITSLVKLFKLLGFEEMELYRRINDLTGGSGAMTTMTDSSGPPRWRIPSAPVPRHEFLDSEKIQSRLVETAAVSALLADIFVEDEPYVAPGRALGHREGAATGQLVPAFANLDFAHGEFATSLLNKKSWSRSEVERLSASYGLPLLDGAIDRINDSVIVVCGDPLIEGDDPLEINLDVVTEVFL